MGRGAEQRLTAAVAGLAHGAQVVADPSAGRPRGVRRVRVQVVGEARPARVRAGRRHGGQVGRDARPAGARARYREGLQHADEVRYTPCAVPCVLVRRRRRLTLVLCCDSMQQDVCGQGLAQGVLTGGSVAGFTKLCGMTSAAAIVLSGGIALSSSGFVLQLLKDKRQLETQHGKSLPGVLLLQVRVARALRLHSTVPPVRPTRRVMDSLAHSSSRRM